jgi:hypothetical protein
MPLNDVYKAAYICRYDTRQNMLLTFAYRVTQIVGAEPSALQYAQALSTSFAAVVKPLLCASAPTPDSYRGMMLHQVDPILTSTTITNTAAGDGTRAQFPAPGAICLATTNRAANSPPGVRGRSYYPRPGQGTDLDATGRPSATYLVDAAALATHLFTPQVINPGAGIQATLSPVIWSKKHDASYLVTQISLEAEWSTQRRRANITGSDQLLL